MPENLKFELRLGDLLYLMGIPIFITSPIGVADITIDGLSPSILSSPAPVDYITALWVLNVFSALGVINVYIYSTFLKNQPERTDRVAKAVHFNIIAVKGLQTLTIALNITGLAGFVGLNVFKVVCIAGNGLFFFGMNIYTNDMFTNYHKAIAGKESEPVPVQYKPTVSFSVLATLLVPLSWASFPLTFLPTLFFIFSN